MPARLLSSRHGAPRLLALLLAVALRPAAADPVPFERELPPGTVVVELNQAEVKIVRGSAPQGSLAVHLPKVRPRRRNPEGAPAAPSVAAELVVEAGKGQVKLKRPAGDPETVRIALELVLPAGTPVRVGGSALAVVVEEAATGEPVVAGGPAGLVDEEPAAGDRALPEGKAEPFPPLELALAGGSQVQLHGVRGLRASLADTWLVAEAVSGEITLGAERSNLELRGLGGALNLSARGSEIKASDLQGGLVLDLAGGRFELDGGEGNLRAQAHEADLSLRGYGGAAVVGGEGFGCEVRGSGLETKPLEITGKDAQGLVEGYGGPLSLSLDGGSFTVAGIRGETQLKVEHGAQLTLHDAAGAVVLTQRGGEVTASDLAAHLKVDLDGGRLDLERLAKVDLAARHGEVTAREVGGVGNLQFSASHLDLDLSALSGEPRLTLRDGSEGRVRLGTPCIVRLAGAAGGLDDTRVRVSSCDLSAPNQGLRPSTLKRNYGGQAVLLMVAVDAASSLDVEGVSRP